MNLLRDKIDTPARQMIIEALVVEIDANHMKELGVQYTGNQGALTGIAVVISSLNVFLLVETFR